MQNQLAGLMKHRTAHALESTAGHHGSRMGASRQQSVPAWPAVCLTLVVATCARADINDTLGDIRNRTTQARDRAAAAKQSADEIRERVRDGVQHLTGEVRSMIQEAVGDLKDQIDQSLEGREEFVNGPGCDDCREKLMTLMMDLSAISNDLLSMTSTCVDVPPVDLSQEIALIENVDCRLLYPICTAFSVDQCLLDDLRRGAEALQNMKQVWALAESVPQMQFDDEDDPTDAELLLAAEMDACEVWLENVDVRQDAAEVARLGMVTEFLGKKLMSSGENQINAQVGIHGYAHVSAKSNFRKSAGQILQGVGANLRAMSRMVVDSKVNYCLEVSRQNLIVANQARILANQERILDALED